MSYQRHVITGTALLSSSAVQAAEPIRSGQAAQVVIGLAVVLALIGVATWLARRAQGLRQFGKGQLRIVEGIAVGTREKLILVEVDNQRVLIGLSPGRIQALAHFPGAPAPDTFSATLAAVNDGPSA